MSRSRFWAAAGTAVAAAVGLATVLYTPAQSGRAMAATILTNLREAAHRGFTIRLSNLEVENIRIDGRADILFPRALSLAELVNADAPTTPDPDSFYAELTVKAGPGGEADVVGLDTELAIAVQPNESWAFIKINQLPDEVMEENPWLEGVLGMFGGGLLLDLNGLEGFISKHLAGDGLLNHPHGSGVSVQVATGEEAADITAAVVNGSRIEVKVDGSAGAAGGKGGAATGGASITATAGASGGAGLTAARGARAAAAPASGKDELAAALSESGADKPLVDAITGALTGTLRREQIPTLVATIEESAGHVAVVEVSAGHWRLTAREFGTQDMDAEERALIGQAALTIDYQDAQGVTRLALTNLGPAAGSLTFEFTDAIDPALGSSQRYVQQGARKIELNSLLQTFGISIEDVLSED